MRRVEKTRGRDPAVSTEAFPLNRVPLCKRQSQFWTGSKTQAEKKKKETCGHVYTHISICCVLYYKIRPRKKCQ